jgi:hypothetical protein
LGRGSQSGGATGGVHDTVWQALAEKLGLTSDELTAQIKDGKTLAQIAEEKGLSTKDLAAVMETTMKAGLDQAVKDGQLTQAQADLMLQHMAGQYEWMITNMGGAIGNSGAIGILSTERKDDEFIIYTNNNAFPNIAFSNKQILSGGLTKLVAEEDKNLSMIYMTSGQLSESCTVDFWKNARKGNGSGDYRYYQSGSSYDWLNNAKITEVKEGKIAVFIYSLQYNIKGSWQINLK